MRSIVTASLSAVALAAATSSFAADEPKSAPAPATPAAADPLAEFYGNTLTINIQDVWRGKMMINADKTYSMSGDSGDSKGTWKMADGKFCTTQTDPKPEAGTPDTCSPMVPRKVGESWENTDSNGIPSTLSLVKGREPAPAPAAAPAAALPAAAGAAAKPAGG